MGRSTTAPGTARSMAGLLALLAASVGALVLLGLRLRAIVPTDAGAARSARVETWIELLVLTGGAVGAVWMLLGSVAALAGVAAVRRGRTGRTAEAVVGSWAPGIVRRLARGAVGAGLGAGLVLTPGAALADEAPPPDAAPPVVLELGWESTAQSAEAVDPGPVTPADLAEPTDTAEPEEPEPEPDSTDSAEEVSPTVSGAQRTSHQNGPDEVVVVRGDTLWDIARRDLPDDASAVDVLRAVTAWHDTNRDVIGDDPDVILPGQVLRAP